MSKKKKIMSLSIDPDLFARLDQYAEKKKGVWGDKKANHSKAICDLLERYMAVDDDVVPIIIKVPASMKGAAKQNELKAWLDRKSDAILRALQT